jgi:hypothetical protein
MSTPNPLTMPKQKGVLFVKPVAPEVLAVLDEVSPAVTIQDVQGPVRPGVRETVVVTQHDGVIKAKNAKPGMTVRAYLHGEPRGGERVIDTVERIDDGAMVRIAFASPHPVTEYKAAYRFFVEDLVGTEVKVVQHVPDLVPYEKV